MFLCARESLLGNEGDGFKIAMESLNRSRPAVGAQALGIAESAMEIATLFAMRRRQFGKPIAKLEGMQFMLADMATMIESAKALVYKAAWYLDKGLAACDKILGHVEVLRLGCGHEDHNRSGSDSRWVRLSQERQPRANNERRQDHTDLRRHQPDPAICRG